MRMKLLSRGETSGQNVESTGKSVTRLNDE